MLTYHGPLGLEDRHGQNGPIHGEIHPEIMVFANLETCLFSTEPRYWKSESKKLANRDINYLALETTAARPWRMISFPTSRSWAGQSFETITPWTLSTAQCGLSDTSAVTASIKIPLMRTYTPSLRVENSQTSTC